MIFQPLWEKTLGIEKKKFADGFKIIKILIKILMINSVKVREIRGV